MLPTNEPEDDALLALCAELSQRQDEYERLWDMTPCDDRPETEADRAWNSYAGAVWPGCRELVEQLTTLHARTKAGARAKAAMTVALMDDPHHDHQLMGGEYDLAVSALRDVLRVGA